MIDPMNPYEPPNEPKFEYDWIECSKELPPCDGYYEATDENKLFTGIVFYDGWAFLSKNIYRNPFYWKHTRFIEKKYGKQNESV